jgi:hypothetical protein
MDTNDWEIPGRCASRFSFAVVFKRNITSRNASRATQAAANQGMARPLFGQNPRPRSPANFSRSPALSQRRVGINSGTSYNALSGSGRFAAHLSRDTEINLTVLAYNLKRVCNLLGVQNLIAALS